MKKCADATIYESAKRLAVNVTPLVAHCTSGGSQIRVRPELAPLIFNDFDVDDVIAVAQSLLSDLPKILNHLKAQERQQFLRFFVPEGL